MMRIHEVMTLRPVTVTPQTMIRDLMGQFDRHEFNAFPVVDEGGGALMGIVTKLDVLKALRPQPEAGFEPSLTFGRVENIMRHGVVVVEPDDPVIVAADLMVETHLRSLPVVRRPGGSAPQLVGIVSQGDLLRALRLGAADPQLATRRQVMASVDT